jgi:hypothetical protein
MSQKPFAWMRVYTLTIVALAFSMLLLAKYGRRQDTVTAKIVEHALTSPAGTDSTLYMQMGEDAFHSADHSIYQQLFFVQHEKFIYPPSSLFVTEALDSLNAHHVSSADVWKIFLVIAWIAAIVVAVILYRIRRRDARWLELVCVAVLGILFLPFAEALYRGQVQIALTLLWGVSILLWERQQTTACGFVLAITCMFKPQLAVFLLWGALRREWRFTVAFAATAVAVLVCSIAHFGWQNHVDYLSVLSYLSRHGEALWANQSLNGLLNRLLRNGNAASWDPRVYPPYRPVIYLASSAFSVICLIVGLLVPKLRRWTGTTEDYVFFGCISVLMSPIAWEHHYGYFFFAMVLLISRGERLGRAQWWVLTACVLAISNRLPKLDSYVMGVRSLVDNYLFAAAIVVLILLAQQASGRATFASTERRPSSPRAESPC